MALPHRHRQLLQRYRQLRATPPTLAYWLRRCIGNWLALTALAAAASLVVRDSPWPGAPWLLCGMVLGAILRDGSMLRSAKANWPMLAQIFDWQRIDELLAEDAAASRDATP